MGTGRMDTTAVNPKTQKKVKKERPAKKNKKGKKGILGGGLVVVGVAAGAGGFFCI